MIALTVLTAAVLAAASVQAHPASTLALAVVKKQFSQAKLVPDIFPEFEPQGTAILNWTSVGISTVGQVIPVNDTALKPSISIKGTAEAEATVGGPFNNTATLYTVLIVDANVAGTTNSTSLVRHYLANNIAYGPNSDHSVLLTNSTPAITDFAGPAPPAGSGPHRYVTLVFAQPENFTAPAELSDPGTAVARFDPNAYIEEAGLTLIAGTYFTVEAEGTPTVSVAATSSVVSTTLAEYTATETGSGPGHNDASATDSAAPGATSAPASEASTFGVSLVAGFVAVGAAVWGAQ